MNIAIIGFSRFGQLWAEIFSQFGDITVFNRSDKSSITNELGYSYYSIDNLDKLSNMDIIFLAVSIDATEDLIKNISRFVEPGAIVMDVCSVKELPCKWLKKYLPKGIQSMGTHPMFGPDSYNIGSTSNQIVLCPVDITSKNQQKLNAIFQDAHLDTVITTPSDHDKQVAYSLAMVHLIGRTLDRLPLNNIKIKSLGFDRLMKIHETVSNDSWELFINMYKYNPYALNAKDEFIDNLQFINKRIVEHKS